MYVREVCRLMRTSNINIVKGDIEFTEIQDEINKEWVKDWPRWVPDELRVPLTVAERARLRSG